ncbi:MAG: class I SAM-dependent RNA methyltransferase [Candidatus Omnitrophota bacterium]
MVTGLGTSIESDLKTQSICPVFESCGGCLYQHLAYEDELRLKREELVSLLAEAAVAAPEKVGAVVPSPDIYHYRHRLDIGIYRLRGGELVMGFRKEGTHRTIPVDRCWIAKKNISDFLPELGRLAAERLPPKYRTANLVVRTGDDGRIFWGGIGRRSLEMEEKDYLWTEIGGRKVYYSLETFFQANLSILPRLIETIRATGLFRARPEFFDLYSGVGLFGLCLEPDAAGVWMIEECAGSSKLAAYNIQRHGLQEKVKQIHGKVEEHLERLLARSGHGSKIAMIDPPRAGLSPAVSALLAVMSKSASPAGFEALLYLSCSPASLVRDLRILTAGSWRLERILPFDFFPRTRHLETLAVLRPVA